MHRMCYSLLVTNVVEFAAPRRHDMPIPYDQLKQALLTEQAALTKELAELQSTIKEEGVGYSTHPADDGTHAFDQARDLAVQVNASRR